MQVGRNGCSESSEHLSMTTRGLLAPLFSTFPTSNARSPIATMVNGNHPNSYGYSNRRCRPLDKAVRNACRHKRDVASRLPFLASMHASRGHNAIFFLFAVMRFRLMRDADEPDASDELLLKASVPASSSSIKTFAAALVL